MKKPDFDAVLNALRTVNDPDLKQDLVTLGMIRDLKVFEDGKVSFRIGLTTPACPLEAQLTQKSGGMEKPEREPLLKKGSPVSHTSSRFRVVRVAWANRPYP